jgi:hypothetical protein
MKMIFSALDSGYINTASRFVSKVDGTTRWLHLRLRIRPNHNLYLHLPRRQIREPMFVILLDDVPPSIPSNLGLSSRPGDSLLH